MRVVAGTLRSRRIATPSWSGLRPTSDRLRETIFNVIGPRVIDAAVLDGFSGTGAIAIEAVSRGAREATCVESDRRAVRLIRENVERCGVADRIAVVQARLETWAPPESWDLIYLDPPYDWLGLEGLLRHVAPLASPGAWIMLEHAARTSPPDVAGPLRRFRSVRSGGSAVSLYVRELDLDGRGRESDS